MNVLLLGSTGMLGQSLKNYFERENVHVYGVARNNADFNLDLLHDMARLREIIKDYRIDVVINTVALLNLNYCEQNPEAAYLVNTHIAGELSKICDELNVYFIQISTDHYYSSDGDFLHSENDKVKLLNVYAKTKFLAEKLVELNTNSLIVRTNIVGYRNNGALTFMEWILDSIKKDQKITGFTDMYTSSIDVDSFSKILYSLILEKATGLINVSADGVLSKYEFIYLFAQKLGKADLVEQGQLDQSNVKRGDSLGLSIQKLITLFPNLKIPTVHEVIDYLVEQYLQLSEEK